MNQLGFSFAIQAAAFWTFLGKTSSESHLQALLDKSLFDADHGTATSRERFGNLPIGVTGVPLTLIAHQEHSGDEIMFGRCPTPPPHRFQKMALLLTQAYRIGVVMGSHTLTPYMVSSAQRTWAPCTKQGQPIQTNLNGHVSPMDALILSPAFL
jgi:hypothetical protein